MEKVEGYTRSGWATLCLVVAGIGLVLGGLLAAIAIVNFHLGEISADEAWFWGGLGLSATIGAVPIGGLSAAIEEVRKVRYTIAQAHGISTEIAPEEPVATSTESA